MGITVKPLFPFLAKNQAQAYLTTIAVLSEHELEM